MRHTEFWERMREQFGEGYADSFARDFVIAELGERTVHEAIADGKDVKDVWRAVCDALELPPAAR
jgi:Protein of unknown function (DUF3046)